MSLYDGWHELYKRSEVKITYINDTERALITVHHIQKWRNLLSCYSSKQIRFNLLQYNGEQCLTGNISETKPVRIHVPWQHLMQYSICWSSQMHSRGSRHLQFPYNFPSVPIIYRRNRWVINLIRYGSATYIWLIDMTKLGKTNVLLKNLSLVSESFQQFGKGLDTKANILITILALVVTCHHTTWHHSLEDTTHVPRPLICNGSSLTIVNIIYHMQNVPIIYYVCSGFTVYYVCIYTDTYYLPKYI